MAEVDTHPLPPGAALPAVEPFFFGAPPLYGCLHPGRLEGRGVVLCPPVGHDYITLHRAIRQLAATVSRAGPSVLRFDYTGTGDSAGDWGEGRLERWIEDVGAAIDTLRQRCGAARVTLAGARLGAALALAAAGRRDDVEALALWDPVVWGRTYLRQLRRDHRRMLRRAHVVAGQAREGAIERLGSLWSAPLVADLRGLEADALPTPRVERVLLLDSRRAVSAPLGALLRTAGLQVESRLDELPQLWRWSEDLTRVELPHSHVRTLARWIVGADR